MSVPMLLVVASVVVVLLGSLLAAVAIALVRNDEDHVQAAIGLWVFFTVMPGLSLAFLAFVAWIVVRFTS